MPITALEPSDDEDWYDDDSGDFGDFEWAPCPECGETVHVITGKCPCCGYWLSDADRRAIYTSQAKPMWLKLTALVLLIALLAGMFSVVVEAF
jgi:hypothetical protein